MKTIEEIRDLMVGKSVITDLADLLRANDAEFAESEKKYLAAVETLRSELPIDFFIAFLYFAIFFTSIERITPT